MLLSPRRSPEPYFYAEFGWTPATGSESPCPAPTRYGRPTAMLSPEHPVTLSWDNGQGLRFQRTIAVDKLHVHGDAEGVEKPR